jgi:hypothetical protein
MVKFVLSQEPFSEGKSPMRFLMLALLAAFSFIHITCAAEQTSFTIADGSFSLAAPEAWQQVQPRSRIVETEFQIPGDGDAKTGRLTVMGAGGTVSANIDRWRGQFTQPDGSDTKDKTSVKSIKMAGCSITLVDIPGTYRDMPGGPFAGGQAIQRPNYRMLAAIIETPESGNYFLKFYGPAATVSKHAAGFQKMIEGLVPATK